MNNLKELYLEWRWLTYNELNEITLKMMTEGKYPLNQGQKFSDNIYNKNYTNENIEKYKNKNFEVSENLIKLYDKKIKLKAEELLKKRSSYYFAQFYFLRSVFIENCFIEINNFTRKDLINEIKRNIIYYHWWDELSFEELSNCIPEVYFLKSTTKLIGKIALLDYFHRRFGKKEDLINCLLNNFIPRDVMINEMNEITRGNVMFDYGWLFRNELTKSIRIFENECRLEYNEKIIGSFFNENILIREIQKKFGEKYTVISQGSPEWLRPQRFDIYFPEINIAIEYQGEQHLYPVDFGGKGEKAARIQFEENIKRDNLKREKAEENGCTIIYVYPEYDLVKVFSDLKTVLEERFNKLFLK